MFSASESSDVKGSPARGGWGCPEPVPPGCLGGPTGRRHRQVPACCSALSKLVVLSRHGWVAWHRWENQTCLPEHLLGNEFPRPKPLLYPQVLISSDC